jgi:hypothetical protein
MPTRALRILLLALVAGVMAPPASAIAATPTISMSFAPTSIKQGTATSLLTVQITNPNATAITSVAFSDTLPSALAFASPSGLTSTCGGVTVAAFGPPATLSLSSGSVAANATCAITANVKGLTAAIALNGTNAVTSSAGTGNSASATLEVVGPPTLEPSFAASPIPFGGKTNLSLLLTNVNAQHGLSAIGFTDTLPSGLVVATPSKATTDCPNATLTATPDASTVSISGASLAATKTCSTSVDVKAVAIGPQANATGNVTSAEGGTGPGGTATVTVRPQPPGLTVSFGLATFPLGGTTSMPFTVSNPNPTGDPSSPLSRINFTAPLPPGLTVASPSGLTGACPGATITAVPGASSIAMDDADLGGQANCTFVVNVRATAPGLKSVLTSPIGSTEAGNGAPASATTTVLAPPTVTISAPAAGQRFAVGQTELARFSCADDPAGPGIASCASAVANGKRISTARAGSRTFTVTATSRDGLTTTRTVRFVVDPVPVITRLRQSGGATFSFRLSRRATVRLAFTRAIRGRRVTTRVTLNAHSGLNVVHRARLAAGAYTLVASARDARGHSAKPRTLRFTVD